MPANKSASQSFSIRRYHSALALIAGGCIAGTLDLVFATVFWGFRNVPPMRIFQSIASGLFGKASFEGGLATAFLGIGLHYFIATSFAVSYYLASVRMPVLVKRPVVAGLAYGVFLYLVMNLVVLPLSAARAPDYSNTAWVSSSIAMHAIIGVICALSARIAIRQRERR